MADLNGMMKVIQNIDYRREYIEALQSNAYETLTWLETFQIDGGGAIREVNIAVEVLHDITHACEELLPDADADESDD